MNKQQKVLIIDDEKANLKILSGILNQEVEVILAKDGCIKDTHVDMHHRQHFTKKTHLLQLDSL